MEHIILSHLVKHLSLKHVNWWTTWEKNSSIMQLISAKHYWAKGIKIVSSETDTIVLGFTKAFDSMSIERLLVKLDFYWIIYIEVKCTGGLKLLCKIVHGMFELMVSFFHKGAWFLGSLMALFWVLCYFFCL